MALKTTKFDAAEYLETADDVAHFLESAFEDNDPAGIAHALGIVARSHGMTDVADKAGVSRQALYKVLTEDGNPGLVTVIGVMKALGFKLVPERIEEAA